MSLRSTAPRSLFASFALVAALGCGGPPESRVPETSPRGGATPPPPAADARESPPPSGTVKGSPFPAVTRRKLDNGLSVAVVSSRALPVVQIRAVVRAGAGFAPASPGAAEITASMLKDGGTKTQTSAKLLERIESLGATLSVDVGPNASTFGLAVTRDRAPAAIALLGELLRAPRFDEGELKKLKSRLADEAADAARASGAWAAMRVLFRAFYPAGSPYAITNLVPSEIAKIDGATVRDFHRRFYVPENVTLVLAGDIDPDAPSVADAFGTWKGGARPKVDFPPATPPAGRRVVVAHRPNSVQSEVFVAGLVPARHVATWPHLRVANQVLGGGVASRLFTDVREKRSLAYATRSQIVELPHGEQPFVAYAGTESAKTAQAVDGLLENLEALRKSGPTAPEVETARRYLSDVFAIRMETIGAIADLVALQEELELPDGYWDEYRAAVRKTSPEQAATAAATLTDPASCLVVVSGDADAIAPELTRFGEVTVIDPEKELKTIRTLPASGR